jgi:hypothetical protein
VKAFHLRIDTWLDARNPPIELETVFYPPPTLLFHDKLHTGDVWAFLFGQALVKLQLGHYTSRIKLRTVKMENYDVILGRDWLERHNAKIDWQRGELRV